MTGSDEDDSTTNGDVAESAARSNESDDYSSLIDGDYLRRYRETLRQSVDEQPVATAFKSWRRYVRDRHGGVFDDLLADGIVEDLPADGVADGRRAEDITDGPSTEDITAEPAGHGSEDPDDRAATAAESDRRGSGRTAVARALFVETLAFDFRLRTVLRAVETRFGCRVSRPLGAGASIPYDPDFESVHDHVRSRLDAPDDERAAFVRAAETFARSAEPAAVARLHRASVSRPVRRVFGRYDTTAGVAELAVGEALGVEGAAEPESTSRDGGSRAESGGGDTAGPPFPTVLDPGCGAGRFLATAARTLLARSETDAGFSRPESPEEASAAEKPPTVEGASSDEDPPTVERLRSVLSSVRGFDVSPTAVRASRLAVVLAVRPLLSDLGDPVSTDTGSGRPTFTPRVVLGDAVDATADGPLLDGQRADVLLVNPPWLTWDGLPERTKSRWRNGPIADDSLDLFGRGGADARLGFANDDLSVPFALTCIDRLLRDGGRAAVVLKRDVLTGAATERVRRPSLGGRPITFERVHDFGSLTPFPDVDAGTALLSLRVGEGAEPETPASGGSTRTSRETPDRRGPFSNGDGDGERRGVPTIRWSSRTENAGADGTAAGRHGRFASLTRMRASLDRASTRLVPADPEDPTSPWIRADAERQALGDSDYRIRHGVKDDAKAVYAVDRETIERRDLEPDHLYPYLKSKHVVKYGLFGYDVHLVPQRKAGEDNEAELRREAPRTYAYLDDHRDRLLDRGSTWFDDGPFYSLFGLGPYTWADYKVVWCRLGFKPHFAVVSTVEDPLLGEQPVVPGDHCMFVGTDDEREAFYLCGLLNSAPYQRCLRDVVSGGKSSLSKATVERLALPEWSGSRKQRRVADLTRRAHEIVPEHVDCSKRAYNRKTIPELAAVQAKIDRAAERFLTAHEGRQASETD